MDSRAIRNSIADILESVAVGPLSATETLDSAPTDTYLTGILWPRNAVFAEREDESSAVASTGGDDTAPDAAVPGYRLIRPCSIGLTFTYRAGYACRVSLGGTSRYLPQQEELSEKPRRIARKSAEPTGDGANETGRTQSGAPESAPDLRAVRWIRQPLSYHFSIPADESREQWRTSDFVASDKRSVNDPGVAVDIRLRRAGDLVTATITLINVSPCDENTDLNAACLFQAQIIVGSPNDDAFIVPRKKMVLASDDDDDAKSNELLFRDVNEFAVGHGVSATWREHGGAATGVATTWTPQQVVHGISAFGDPVIEKAMEGATVNPFAAATPSQREVRPQLCEALRRFCGVYAGWIDSELRARLGIFDSVLGEAAALNLKRCDLALQRISKGVDLLAKNDQAWRAFQLASRAMDDQARYPSKKERAGPLVWRPFQLAFILLVIPCIVDEKDDARNVMDLLWFPTGGGKTEAYLALTAFTIFYKRLTSATRRQDGGMDVLMRYTLRLLTVQQFQRAAAVIHACDVLRAADEARLGTARITVGLYVGSETTPNKLEQAAIRIGEEIAGEHPHSSPRQLLECPVCGADLPPSAYVVQPLAGRLKVICPNNKCASKGADLPVAVVDETIYTNPPSFLIGTVDKFAQLPRRGDLRNLFGLDTSERPSLIIQDELHLISGPLGSMTGLYEAAVDILCTKEKARPKIIGSSATIGRAATQVRALFDRDVLLFPPPGYDAGNSFFAYKDEREPERLYLGISSAGRSPKFALQAVLGTLLQAAHKIATTGGIDAKALDPYWTCVAYFNSLRELGGAIVMMLDDVPRTIAFAAGLLKTDARALSGVPKELSSRIPSNEIPLALKELGAGLGGDPFDPSPVDAVLASNMISVGVDVPRLGLMVVNGQPKSTAEYIQATSRVGRRSPGLIVTVYNFGRPRDVSHFEHFRAYHSALHRTVEATSVTPWAPRARDKALHAVLATLVRHLVPQMEDDEAAVDFEAASTNVKEFLSYLAKRASSATEGREEEETMAQLAVIVSEWGRRAESARASGHRLLYWERRAPFGRTAPHLMRDAERMKGTDSRSWPTPNSLREIEPSTAFVLRRHFRERKHSGATDE